jgi:ribosome-associated protein
MDSKQLALLCRALAENRKAESIAVLDVRKVSGITDYFVIATGTSEPHLRAIVDEITDKLREDHGVRARCRWLNQTSWIVLDFFDVIIHVMRAEARNHYDLESLWGDAPRVRPRKKKAQFRKITKRNAVEARKGKMGGSGLARKELFTLGRLRNWLTSCRWMRFVNP